jgi:hypothetical protein
MIHMAMLLVFAFAALSKHVQKWLAAATGRYSGQQTHLLQMSTLWATWYIFVLMLLSLYESERVSSVVTLLICILVVRGFNFGWVTRSLHRDFSWLSAVTPGKFWTVYRPQVRLRPLPYISFTVHYSLSNCLRPLEAYGRGFESHSTHGCLSTFILCLCCPVQVPPLGRADPPSKESYRLSTRLILIDIVGPSYWHALL